MNRIVLCAVMAAILFASCGKTDDDQVLEKGYDLFPSDIVLDDLAIEAKLLPSCSDDPSYSVFKNSGTQYTSYQDVLIRFSPVMDREMDRVVFYQSNEMTQACAKWKYAKLEHNYPSYKTDVCAPYSTSLLDEKVIISSDKALFGSEPGMDISSHFSVLSDFRSGAFVGHLMKSFEYSIACEVNPYVEGKNLPVGMEDYFSVGTVLFCTGYEGETLPCAYCIVFKDYPTELYKEVTLTVEMPVEEQLFRGVFSLDGTMDETKITTRKRVLMGSVLLSF